MKRFFTILCLCSLLFAFTGCSGTAPVATEASTVTETTTAASTTEATTTESAITETTAETTVETTAETNTAQFVEMTFSIPMDNWPYEVGNYPYHNSGKTGNTMTVSLPATWENNKEGYSRSFVDTVSGDTIFFDCVYFSDNYSLFNAIKRINAYTVTVYNPVPVYNPVVEEDAFYLMSDGSDVYLCSFRVGEDYIVALEFRGTAHDISFLREIAKTVTVEPIYAAETQTIQINEELRPIQTQTDRCITAEYGWSIETKELDPPLKISLSLPASWKELPLPESYQSNTVLYAELSPHGGACRDACLYQAFYATDLVLANASISSLPEKSETYQSEKGLTYWFNTIEYPVLHAISYNCCIQLSDKYVYNFHLCADSDDPDLVHRIANTIEIAGK